MRRFLELIRLRNDHPAFDGTFVCGQPSDTRMTFRWTNVSYTADLAVNFKNGLDHIRYNHQNRCRRLSKFGRTEESFASRLDLLEADRD